MAVFSRLSFLTVAALFAVGVSAESHTIKFQNNCGHGTPQLITGGKVVSTGEDFTYDDVFMGIAYLQTGPCLFNAENCLMVEMTLVNPNPHAPGSGSSVDFSLIAPHDFNVPAAFSFFDGCDGQGTQCLTSNCNTAFFHPDDTWVQVACQDNNVGLLIEFCPNGVGAVGGGSSPPPSSISVAKPPPPPPTSTTSVAPIPTTSKTVVSTSIVATSSSAVSSVAETTSDPASTDDTASSSRTTAISTSIAPSSVVSTSAAQSSSPVNRKQCQPGQKLVPKRKIAAKREAEALQAAKREAIAHHRRGHGHH